MTGPTQLSFELFPATSEIGRARMAATVEELKALAPRFFSVTCGADGAQNDLTSDALSRLSGTIGGASTAAHITCRAGSRAEVIARAKAYEAAGSRWIVALRGDAAEGAGATFAPLADGFADAPELIAALRRETGLRIAVGGYPEPHPDSRGARGDLEHLRRKIDAGADTIVTQFFFENDDFYRYVDECRKAGIDVPIVPGIMPIGRFDRVARFAERCGARIPARLADRFEKAEKCGAVRELALAVCAGQCDELRDQGVSAFHFYTLNSADLTLDVCRALDLDPDFPVDGEAASADRNGAVASLTA